MAPSRTRARPSGREQRSTAKKDEPVTAAESGAPTAATPKRGRGRPPKNGVSKQVKVPTGRPRGRPPKDPSQKATPKPKAKTTTTGTGRRGRPPKAATVAAAAAAAGAATPTSTGKRRGRPRKSDVAAPVAEPEKVEDEQEDAPADEVEEEDGGKS